MRQLFLEKGNIVIKEVSQPLLDDHSVLVSVEYSCMSLSTEHSDTFDAQNGIFNNVPNKIKKIIESVASHGIDGTKALIKEKLVGRSQTIGYSCSGRVIAVGSKVKKFHPGDLVACAGQGQAHHADIVCVPEHLIVQVHAQEYLKTASLTATGAAALQAVRRAHPALGETVCVFGLGLLGQMMVQLAKLSGCTVIGIDTIPQRLEMAKKSGADYVFDGSDEQVKTEIDYLTHHYGVDITFITHALSNDVMPKKAIEVTRKKGKIVLVSDSSLNVSRDVLCQKEIDFLISCSYASGRHDALYEKQGYDYPYEHVRWTEQRNMQAFVQLIEEGKLRINELISHEVDIEDAAQAYDDIKNHAVLGIVLTYAHRKQETTPLQEQKKELSSMRFMPARSDVLSVGMVGVGEFAKIKLLPTISKLADVKINAIVDADVTNSMSVAKMYGAARALVNDQELFTDDSVDVVVIASPHKFHCDQALKALQNGKAVFLEKPMVTDAQQLLQIKNYLSEHPQAPFCVDYNRAFSPYMQKIKQAIAKRHSPLVIHYRMNAGFISKEHWVQSDLGAGRIIGEACHIFDLFCFLTESKPISVSVEAVHVDADDVFPTDNFSAQISFEDGSICTLLYTALGHQDLGRERMELFFDSKTIVMDDYAQLHGFGFANTFHETTMLPNKGHENLLTLFFENIKKPVYEPPISVERLNMVAQLTLIIDALACEGGGEKKLSL